MQLWVFLFTFLLPMAQAAPINYALILTANDESREQALNIQFSEITGRLSRQLLQDGWSVQILFSGDATRLGMSADFVCNKVKPFNNRSLIETLAQAERLRWDDGSQLLIYVNTHGTRGIKMRHHCIVSDADACISTETVDLFLRRMEAAHPRIRMAFIDATCESGNSIDLASNQTCVLAGSSSNADYGFYDLHQPFIRDYLVGGRRSIFERYRNVIRRSDNGLLLPQLSIASSTSARRQFRAVLEAFPAAVAFDTGTILANETQISNIILHQKLDMMNLNVYEHFFNEEGRAYWNSNGAPLFTVPASTTIGNILFGARAGWSRAQIAQQLQTAKTLTPRLRETMRQMDSASVALISSTRARVTVQEVLIKDWPETLRRLGNSAPASYAPRAKEAWQWEHDFAALMASPTGRAQVMRSAEVRRYFDLRAQSHTMRQQLFPSLNTLRAVLRAIVLKYESDRYARDPRGPCHLFRF